MASFRFYSAFLIIMLWARWASAGFSVKHFSGKSFRYIMPRQPAMTTSSHRISYRPFFSGAILRQQSQGSGTTSLDSETVEFLQQILHDSLQRIHLDPEEFHRANEENMRDPTTGYDATFGRPAIRTYRSFIFTNKAVGGGESASQTGNSRLLAAADRCARQIDFLRRRHRAQSEDWVRNHDSQDKRDKNDTIHTPIKRFPIILVMDNLRSAFNVGSIFRTADACGCQEVITVR